MCGFYDNCAWWVADNLPVEYHERIVGLNMVLFFMCKILIYRTL